jgi:hypothetical protein
MPLGKLRQDYHPIPYRQHGFDRAVDTVMGSSVIELRRSPAAHPAERRANRWRPARALGFVLSASVALWLTILLIASHMGSVA